jgi:biotin carboxyl carrier protein
MRTILVALAAPAALWLVQTSFFSPEPPRAEAPSATAGATAEWGSPSANVGATAKWSPPSARAGATRDAAPPPATSPASTVLPSPASTPEVFWTPERPVQGHLFRITVPPVAGEAIRSVEGEAGGEPLRFEATPDGALESLAPVPIDTEGSLELSLVFIHGDGRREAATHTLEVAPGDYRHERLNVAPRFGSPLNEADAARLAQDQAKANEVARQALSTPRIWTEPRVLPREDRVTSGFGHGRVFNGQVSSRHMGLDLDGDPGDVIVAPTRGVVALVDAFLLAGNIVYLNHGGGLLSGYFHLSEALVSVGDTVEAGTPIGTVGATGRVTGPHLHWVVRYGTTSVDPRSFLALP